ncbi:MAG: molybdopterin-guanine dinucleotide biosynthesis protein B [Desulfobacterales bacterium]|nr:molybdopterin-guanine dinucleotide biosynthesis protein B [Desulfobacterales bacterium]
MNLKDNDISPENARPALSLPPLVCIVGYAGSGKTTLMVDLIDGLARRGYRVGTIKHDSQGGRVDHPGKDSFRHKAAGAATSIISSPRQVAMVTDVEQEQRPEDLLGLMAGMDIVMAEGYKRAPLPKIEVFRSATGKEAACRGDAHLLAVVSDTAVDWGVPCFAMTDVARLVDFVVQYFDLRAHQTADLKLTSS